MAFIRSLADVRAALERKGDEISRVQQRIDATEEELKNVSFSEAERTQIRRNLERYQDEKKYLRDDRKDLQVKLDESMFPSVRLD